MGLGMSGLAMPTSIFMIMSFLALLQMSPSSICLNRTVACLVRTSLPRQLWRPCKITSPTITRYVGYISLLLTCGGHGSTTLPGPGRLPTNFGVFLIVMTHVEWALSGQRAPLRCRRFAFWLCSGWLWMPLLPCVASKRRAILYSIGYLYSWHAVVGPILLSPTLGHH